MLRYRDSSSNTFVLRNILNMHLKFSTSYYKFNLYFNLKTLLYWTPMESGQFSPDGGSSPAKNEENKARPREGW